MNQKVLQNKIWHIKHDKQVEIAYHVLEVITGTVAILGILALGLLIMSIN